MGDRKRGQDVDVALKGMFKALESRALPDRIRSVVDQLDEGAAPETKRKTGG